LGPWMNSFGLNVFTMFIIGVLVTLSLILTAAVLFPGISGGRIEAILGIGASLAGISVAIFALSGKRHTAPDRAQVRLARIAWRMPAPETLGPIRLTPLRRTCMIVLRGYLVVAVMMVIVRVVQTAVG
jgi:hypothetical protein